MDLALTNAPLTAWPVPDLVTGLPANSSDLHEALARDVAALDVELERARALLAVSINGYELKNMSEQWRADRGVVLAAVQQCGEAMRFASSELVQDRVVVLAAVLANPWALRFAAQHVKGDKHVVIAAVRQDPGVIEFASAGVKRDPEVFLNALSREVLHFTLAAPGVAGIVCVSGAREANVDLDFLRHFDQELLVRFSTAVADWVARLAANGDEEAAHRQQHFQKRTAAGAVSWCALSCFDVAGWVTSKLDRRKALMVLHRSDARILRSALAAKVLEYL
mmetsp:Transcript_52808/g.106032  ORF Transcript_52808/g.106032 Transcript_52808/m.106032 type:complete len:280 (+) Transcript_52808:84-923(+)